MGNWDATRGSKLTIVICERADDLVAWIRDRKGALRHCPWVSQRLYTAGGIGELMGRGIELSTVESGQECSDVHVKLQDLHAQLCK